MNKQVGYNTHELGSVRIRQEVLIDASPEEVFAALTQDTSFWWGEPYLLGDSPLDLKVECRLGGMVYEEWGNGDGAIWGQVTQWKKDRIFEFSGRCGMSGAVTGVICFALETRGKSTLLRLEHDAAGQLSEQAQRGYTFGWNDLIAERLKPFVEKGECHGIRKRG